MSYDPKENGLAARLSANGFAFSVRHALSPIIDRGQALMNEFHARSIRRRGQQEIEQLPDYLRQDIGMPRTADRAKHNKL